MKVDQNTLLLEEGYTPVAGCEYEIAPGVVGTMKPITVRLQEELYEKVKENEKDFFSATRVLLDGIGETEEKDCYYGMPERVVADFFSLLMMIGTGLSNSSASFVPSQEEESQETQES